MVQGTRRVRVVRRHHHALACAYADPATDIDRFRGRLRLRVTGLGRPPHAPFVVVELDEPPGAEHRRTAGRVRSLAGDPPAQRALARKILGQVLG